MNSFEKFKEKVFLARLHALDENAFKELYDGYIDRMYRYIYFKVSTQEEAQDLTSEVFLKIWDYIYKSKGRIENINAFLYRTARNSVIDYYRKNSERRIDSAEFQLGQSPDQKQLEIFRQIELGVEYGRIQKFMKTLQDEYREIIILKYIEQLTDREIAKITERSRASVRVMAHRGLEKLRQLLENEKPQ